MKKRVSKATLRRYPVYLKALRTLKSEGKSKVMSQELSEQININPTTIRRDFSFLGNMGKQGYGYDIDLLIDIFSNQLGVDVDEKIILLGVGNLGKAILNYNHWDYVAGKIVACYDIFPENVGKVDIPLYHLDQLKETIPDGCKIAIITGQTDIQNTVNKLIDAGITAIVDFTNVHFNVPDHVKIRTIDVVSSIQELVFEINQ